LAEKLGIPRLLDVEDLQQEKPDERSVMTYVSEYFHRFARQELKELAARRAAKFLRFAKAMNQRKYDYETRARALIEWSNAKQAMFSEEKFGETLDDAKAAFSALKEYMVTEKPPKIGEKLDLEALFAEIQTELKVNDRAPYVPPADLSPESIEANWTRLTLAEQRRSQEVRENRFKFIKKAESFLSEEKIQELKDSFNHFDANRDDSLDKMEFKAANAAMGVPFSDEAHFYKVFGEVSESKGVINLEQYMKYMKKIQEDSDSADQLKESFQTIADDKEFVTPEQLAIPPLTEDDIKYLLAEMPTVEGGYDYNSFVNKNYSAWQ